MSCSGNCGSNLPCGCCAGIQIATPVSEVNSPGLSALSYRVGTYATFFETMVARLSNLYLDVPSAGGNGTDRIYPLKQLTTRELTDPSIAMLDAWAVVADVLTFYQERIANEGYLPTAIQRRSILELAALVGYQLRPGVAASVYLAFTVSGGFDGTIPAGTRAQSVPGTGQTPQFFETSLDLAARDTWNNLQPRLTRPQVIAMGGGPGIDPALVRTLYFTGLGTNLKPGDSLLTTLSDIPVIESTGNQVLRPVDTVTPQPDDNRTLVTLVMPPLQVNATDTPQTTVTNALQSYVTEASRIFPGSDIAAQVAQTLTTMLSALSAQVVGQLQQVIPGLQTLLAIAEKRNFTRLQVWLTDLVADIETLIEVLPVSNQQMVSVLVARQPSVAVIKGRTEVPSTLANLGTILGRLTASPSVQPANSLRLSRSIQTSYAAEADTIPRLIAALNPAASSLIYSAWQNVVTAPSPVRVFASRAKAALFASNFAGQASYNQRTRVTSFAPTNLTNTWNGDGNWNGLAAPGVNAIGIGLQQIALDTTYDQIKPRSWIVIDRPNLDANQKLIGRTVTYHRILNIQTQNLNTATGFAAKSTVLTLDPPWMSDLAEQDLVSATLTESLILRDTVVYAQAEELDLTEEPLDRDVENDTIELDGLYDGLEPGRWIIVSGERTDIGNVTGVTSSELVMIASVQQSSSSASDPVHTTLTIAKNLSYSYDCNNITIYGNVVNATHGQTVGEVVGDGDGSQTFQSFALHQSPLTYISAPTSAGAQSTLAITVNEVKWTEVGDLSSAGPRDRDYITRTDDSDNTTAIFGNGQHGARVPTGSSNVKAVYRYGIGSPGNVDAGQISQLATHPLGLQAVINPIAATGGVDRDSAGRARSNTPIAVMALDRLVSVQDYADFARAYAGIGKASSARITDGRRQLVYLTIAAVGDVPIDVNSDLYNNLVTSLSTYGDPYLPIQVAVRSVKLLVISARVQILPDYQWESVEPNIRAAVLALFSFEARDLGQTAYLSEAIGAMQAVKGVSYVNVQVFDSVAEDITDQQLAALAGSLKIKQYVEAQLAQLNPSATDPTQRIVPAQLVFMLPDIPDTLILTQIGA
jgi:hypothetical protein